MSKSRIEPPFKRALITGASSGIGKAVAELLAAKGINLILVARDLGRLNALEKSLSHLVEVEILSCDLAKSEERREVMELLKKRKPDLIINNAGIGLYGDILKSETKKTLNLLHLNAEAVSELTIEGARTLIEAHLKGVILNVSSVAGFFPFPGFAMYGATKAFVTTFSEALDFEFKDSGIRVLAACPGHTPTRFQKRSGNPGLSKTPSWLVMPVEEVAAEIWEQVEKRQPVRIINWKYRLLKFFTSWCIPKKVLFRRLHQQMKAIR